MKKLDTVLEKGMKLSKLENRSTSAIEVVTKTINELNQINSEIDNVTSEIQSDIDSLSSTIANLNARKTSNKIIIEKFSNLINE